MAAKERKEAKRMSDDSDIRDLCNLVRVTAFDVRKFHGPGHLEKIYENALAHRLRKQGLVIEQQWPLQVRDEDGTVLGDYFADLWIEGRLIVELKAVKAIINEHVAQLLGYLRSARVEHGLLINFGGAKFEIRKFAISDWLRNL